MEPAQGSHVVIGLTGFGTEVDGVKVSREHFIRAELPQSIGREDVQVLRRDLELLSGIAEQHPDDFTALTTPCSSTTSVPRPGSPGRSA